MASACPSGCSSAAEPGGAKAHREDDADEVNERDFGADERLPRHGEKQQQEGQEKAGELRHPDRQETGERRLERGADVFGKALPDFRERAIHAAGREGEGLAIAQAQPLGHPRRDFPPERHILDDVAAHRRVSADRFVGRAREEHELPIGRAEHAPPARGEKRAAASRCAAKEARANADKGSCRAAGSSG